MKARTRIRHDGWTKARREAFLAALASTGNVRAAAEAVGMSAQTAYRLRRRDPVFATEWDLSATARMHSFLDIAMERATHGTIETEYRGGKLAGYRIKPDDQLLTKLLQGPSRPSRKRILREFAIVPLNKVTPGR